LLSHVGPLVWDVSPKPIGTTVKRRKLARGFLQESSARATPWAIPTGAADPARFAPAVEEAIFGYVKSSPAPILEIDFRRRRVNG
jgi:hypothetical protein